MRRYWTILLFAPAKVGWHVTYRVNRKLAPIWGPFTPALCEKDPAQ